MQFHLFVIISFIEHNLHKIILNIYFDHTHIMCLYRVFSVYCTGYTLVDDCGRNIEGRTKGSGTKRGIDRKSTRLNSSHGGISRMPSSA